MLRKSVRELMDASGSWTDMGHVILLGDSILDNGAYVPGEPDVVRQVRAELPEGWKASLRAVDGAVTARVPAQMQRLPDDATHLAISAGGNDALGDSHLLRSGAATIAEAVLILAEAQQRFARQYDEMIEAVLPLNLPTAVCTIYDTPSTAPEYRAIRTALSLFNDVITRTAFANRLSLIDLRLICDEDVDYANPIEPSARGGAKIAAAIADWAAERRKPASTVFARR